ncbi:MAG: hypothetical protein HQM08_23005 [Candidatus Riflebacteria bacterium]|nr:hypothetical protein [Candidatus Riflebacteria bacterium]
MVTSSLRCFIHPRGPRLTTRRSIYIKRCLLLYASADFRVSPSTHLRWVSLHLPRFTPSQRSHCGTSQPVLPDSALSALGFSQPLGRSVRPDATCRFIPLCLHSQGICLQSFPAKRSVSLFETPAPSLSALLHGFLHLINRMLPAILTTADLPRRDLTYQLSLIVCTTGFHPEVNPILKLPSRLAAHLFPIDFTLSERLQLS